MESFINVFFEEGDVSHIEQFIEDAFLSCPDGYPDLYGNEYCRNYCIDPRCVVDYLLDIEAGLSNYQKSVLVSRYLGEVMGLTEEEVNWLVFNEDVLNEVYNGLLTDQNLGRCGTEDCGLAGGYHEYIIQSMDEVTLAPSEVESLLTFFSVLQCDDPELYDCFRTAQQNPEGDLANFLDDIKETLTSASLLDGCDDLSPYSDRWYELATFNALDVTEIEDKLEDLGDEYWIQTLENATNTNDRWWGFTPYVNMDFFGVTIDVLPNHPISGEPFTPEGFFNYVQSHLASPPFLYSPNSCEKSFEYISVDEQLNWIDGDVLTTVFTIQMPDDGNVICSQYESGEYWTFSTLNAPGWFEGDSWDGFHPVSGNRRFGIIENSDGTYTFYTSGVDRLTGFWHAFANWTPFLDAFIEADIMWECMMTLVVDFINNNGGTASVNFDCTTVRPKWIELKNEIKQGCDGFVTSLEDFPCEQAEPCQ